MFKTKRKRAVALALIAFFCTAAVTYVAVDWKRFGGGFLAFFKSGKNDAVASSGNRGAGSKAVQVAQLGGEHQGVPALPVAKAAASRKRTSGVGGGAGGPAGDDDLFKYGDPAAGGIPPGNFIVAQNDTPAGGSDGSGGGVSDLASPSDAPATPEGNGPGVGSPAPAPGNAGGGSFGGSPIGGSGGTPPAPTPGSPPAATPPAATPPAGSPPADTPPASPPIQSGTTDPGTPPPPSSSLPPVSAVPEASSTAMITLGLLFAAAAASRKRKPS